MKNLIYLFLSIMMVFSLQAQDQDRDRDQDRLQEHLLIQDGQVLRIRDRDQIQLREQLALEDGSIVYPDGSFRTANGLQLRLQDGQCLDLEGNLYPSQEQLRQHMQVQNQARNQLHYVYMDGKMYRVENQEQTQLRERVALENGASINPDGSFQLRDQQQKRLRDGECLDPEGNLYNTQAQFRQHAQLRLQALAGEHFVYQDGAMYRIQNQQRNQLRENVALQNGLTVSPDGSFQMRNQERVQMENGEVVDAEGNLYASREQFRQQVQTRQQAMNQQHFEVQAGQLYMVQNQVRAHVNEQLNLPSGLKVNPDGTYQLKNQQQARLQAGEFLDMEGNRYSSQEQFREKMQTQLTAMSEPHFMFQNGNVYRFQNQVQFQIHEPWRLENGVTVRPDGTYQTKNGKTERLRNGECLDWEGKRYETRDRFREKMEMRVRDRMDMREREIRERKEGMKSGKRMGDQR